MDNNDISRFVLDSEMQRQLLGVAFAVVGVAYVVVARHYERRLLRNRTFVRHETRLQYLDRIIGETDIECVQQLRMDRRSFGRLCELLRGRGGLKTDGNVLVEEQVCTFLHILAHHVKVRTICNRFFRSSETISRHFNSVLRALIRLHGILLQASQPILEDCTDERWKCFKNCLGALDGTYIPILVPAADKPRYRTRKGEIATNVLGVCSPDMMFIFVLPGWEGSASDSRILRDALSRPTGLRVPLDMDVGSSSCNVEQDIERRRVWTSSETEALLDALDDAIARGGQCDNGTFRPGVLKQVEQMLAAKLPGCSLKANPHIESKMRKLKKDYAIVFDMLKTSGFGWNDSQKFVQVDSDTVWNSYIQHHPSARGWRNKPFPYFERLSRIFGRDRATGAAAETPAEMEAHESASRESFEELGDEIPQPSFNEPPGIGTSNQSTSSSRKRKREDPLAIGLEKMSSSLEKMVEMMTNQRAHEYAAIQDSVGELDDILNNMGYGTYDRVRLLNLFVEQPTKMALFRGLKTDEARQQFVLTLLSML